MLLGIEFGQKYYRLHVGRSGEEVHPLGLHRPVAQLPQPLHVPGQGGRVAGHIDDARRPQPRQDGGHLGAQTLPGRVHADHVGPHPLPGQLVRHRPGVPAEELPVGQAVPPGVFPGVPHGLGDELRPDDPARPPGQGQGDGADAAVQVQHRLRPGEAGEVQGDLIEFLRLGPVDLEEGGHRQPEGGAQQLLLQPVPPPQGAVPLPQDHVGVPGVGVQHHSRQAGLCRPQGLRQLPLPGQTVPVDHCAHQALPRPVGAHVQVPHQAGPRPLVIGGDLMLLHPAPEGRPQAGDRRGLEQAVGGVQHVVAPGPVVADGQTAAPLCHGELDLVAVAVGLLRPQDGGQVQAHAPHPLQGVGDAPALGPQLLGVGHVPVLAAPAPAVQGTAGVRPLRGGAQQLLPPAPGHRLVHLHQPHPPLFPVDGAGDKDHPALQPGHPHPLGGVAGDVQGVDGILSPVSHGPVLLLCVPPPYGAAAEMRYRAYHTIPPPAGKGRKPAVPFQDQS